MSIEAPEREAPGSEYKDSPPATPLDSVLNRLALRFERTVKNMADKSQRSKAPLTPTRRELGGVLAVALAALGTAALRLGGADYVGSKADAAARDLGIKPPLPTPTPVYKVSVGADVEYTGTKDHVEFRPEGTTKYVGYGNIFVQYEADGVGFDFYTANFSHLIQDSKLPAPVTSKYMVPIIITTQDLQTEADNNAVSESVENLPTYQNYVESYYKSSNLPLKNRGTLAVVLSIPQIIRDHFPTRADFVKVAPEIILSEISYAVSFKMFKGVQNALAHDIGKGGKALTDSQVDTIFARDLKRLAIIDIKNISPSLIDSIYQEVPVPKSG